jgi:Glycogen recognition site of AMP-activated protein kinase
MQIRHKQNPIKIHKNNIYSKQKDKPLLSKSKAPTKAIKTQALQIKHKNKPFLSRVLLFIVITFGSIFSQETVDWIHSYSSQELTGRRQQKLDEEKIYYYWQMESLKKAVSPRYIRLIDIEFYKRDYKFLNRGILFTYNGLKNSEVELCGNFSAWKCIPMNRNRYGIFYTLVPTDFSNRAEEPNTSYEYKFKVDGLFDFDPENSNRYEDGEGSFFSEYILENTDIEKQVAVRILEDELKRDLDFKTVEFRIYKPEAVTIALVGEFNGWNPEHDYLQKDKNGLFVLRKKLKPGEYLYNFIVDGQKILDLYNSETRLRAETDELSSYVKVEDATSGM